MKKVDYVIFYEHISREWEGVCLLQKELKRKGLKGVILPIHYWKNLRVLFFNPKIVITPFLYDSSNTQHLDYYHLYQSAICLDLHSEQIIDESTKNMYGPKDDYAKNVNHISWGECFAESLIKNGTDLKKIYVTGSIRNDGMIINFDKSEENDILICTSFSNTFVDSSYIDRVLEQHDINKDVYLEKINLTREMKKAYFLDIQKYALANKNKKITLRPHPYVELDVYKKSFLEINKISQLPKNIKIERKGSVHEAISKASKVICWQSSVLLDSAIMNKKVFMLEPFDVPKFMQVPFSNNFVRLKSLFDLEQDIKHKVDLRSYIKYIYGDVDGKSAKRVSDVIQHLITSEFKGYKSLNKRKFLHHFINLYKDIVIFLLKCIGLLKATFPLYEGVLEDDKFKLSFKVSKKSSGSIKFIQTDYGKKIQ